MKYKCFAGRFLSFFVALVFCASAYSASGIEYGTLVAIENYPQLVVTEHNQCNQTEVTKSPINNKSLNPLCNVCLGENDQIDTEKNKYAHISKSITGYELDFGACKLAVDQESNAAIYADWNMLCSTRGGTAIKPSNTYFLCGYGQVTP